MGKTRKRAGLNLDSLSLAFKPSPQYALSTSPAGAGIALFSGSTGLSASSASIHPEILQRLDKAINRLRDIRNYWQISFLPSLEAARNAFNDLAETIELLQRAQQDARITGAPSMFLVQLDNIIKSISDARAEVRVLGNKLSDRRRPTDERLAEMSEHFELNLNTVLVSIEQLLFKL